MIFDFPATANRIQHSFTVWVGQKLGFDLNIDLADTDENMESHPVANGDECMSVDIRKDFTHRVEDSMKETITTTPKSRDNARQATLYFAALQNDHDRHGYEWDVENCDEGVHDEMLDSRI